MAICGAYVCLCVTVRMDKVVDGDRASLLWVSQRRFLYAPSTRFSQHHTFPPVI